MKPLFLVTGALGHLGNVIVKSLLRQGYPVRGLALPGDDSTLLKETDVPIFRGDICDKSSLEPFFTTDGQRPVIVIHTAGIVSISSRQRQKVYDVNVGGTCNIIEMCRKYAAQRLVYVSSVHAIPEKPKGQSITEVSHFSESSVEGLYAKTKAEATQKVLDSVKDGLNAVVVHPSGIVGPGDPGHGHLTQMVIDFLKGHLTAMVKGGYDFVDVRDVADGVIEAALHGEKGQCYILSNQYTSVPDLMKALSKVSGKKEIRTVLPMWFAKLTAPLAECYYRILRQPPLFTRYSLYTLQSNANFSHSKAERDLSYHPRSLESTLKDTVIWLKNHGILKKK